MLIRTHNTYKQEIVIADPEFKKDDFINDISKHPFNPVKDTLVYIEKSCSIPRSKLKTALDNYGAKVTYDYKKADYIVLSKNFLNYYTSVDYSRYIKRSELDKYIKAVDDRMLLKSKLLGDFTEITKFVESLLVEYKTGITITYQEYTKFFWRFDSAAGGSIDVNVEYPIYVAKKEESIEFLEYINANKTKLISDESVLKLLNSSIIMDEKLFKTISDCLESSDIENVNLGIETMSNCDYEKSAVYLLLLLKQYGNLIGDSRNKNHINFKALIAYFGIEKYSIKYVRLDHIIEILDKKGLLTKENIDIITPYAEDDIQLGVRPKYFRIKEIEFIKPGSEEES